MLCHGPNYDRNHGYRAEGFDEMKIVGICMLAGAWIGGGWYFAVVGWILFEYGSLNEGVYKGRKDGKIQTVRKLDERIGRRAKGVDRGGVQVENR